MSYYDNMKIRVQPIRIKFSTGREMGVRIEFPGDFVLLNTEDAERLCVQIAAAVKVAEAKEELTKLKPIKLE